MAGDWIKMRGNLWDDPRVSRLCDLTDQSEAAIVGGLYWLWATADQHTEDGVMPGLTLRQIDRKTGVQGLGQALCDIGWLADHPEGVRIINFEEHNGASAKRRATDAQRKANVRNVSASDADKPRTDDGQKAPNLGAREEKRREEKKTDTSPAKLPTCPTQDLIDLYHEILPDLPKVRLHTKDRTRALQKTWTWCLTSLRSDGHRRAETAEQAAQWFRDYFTRAGQNDFLMGRTPRSGEHANWRCDLDFLLTDRGMKHVIEKTLEPA